MAWTKLSRKEGGLAPCALPLIADLDKSIAKQFGVLYENSGALRGLFIMDPQGVVRSATINDLPITPGPIDPSAQPRTSGGVDGS